MKKFTFDVVESWIWWTKLYRSEEVDHKEAVEQLKVLQQLVNALKKYPR